MRPYKAKKLPLSEIPWEDFVDLLGRAHFTLGKIEEIFQRAQPKKIFSTLIAKEAIDSLKPHRLHISLERFFDAKKRPREIDNYARALTRLVRSPKGKSISLSLINELHRELYRGFEKKKAIGRIREWQNWMGTNGCSKEEAYFLPPKPEDLPDLLSNLMKYVHTKEKDPLVQLAIFFAQFLIIHPFMDGNGRVIRALFPFFLYKKKLLSHPFFFCSHFLNEHRVEYFTSLNNISFDGNWTLWLRFFLTAIVEDGEKSCKKMEKMFKLHSEMCALFDQEIVDTLFQKPVFEEKDIRTPWRKTLSKLARKGFLKKKKKRWFFPPLLRILQEP